MNSPNATLPIREPLDLLDNPYQFQFQFALCQPRLRIYRAAGYPGLYCEDWRAANMGRLVFLPVRNSEPELLWLNIAGNRLLALGKTPEPLHVSLKQDEIMIDSYLCVLRLHSNHDAERLLKRVLNISDLYSGRLIVTRYSYGRTIESYQYRLKGALVGEYNVGEHSLWIHYQNKVAMGPDGFCENEINPY